MNWLRIILGGRNRRAPALMPLAAAAIVVVTDFLLLMSLPAAVAAPLIAIFTIFVTITALSVFWLVSGVVPLYAGNRPDTLEDVVRAVDQIVFGGRYVILHALDMHRSSALPVLKGGRPCRDALLHSTHKAIARMRRDAAGPHVIFPFLDDMPRCNLLPDGSVRHPITGQYVGLIVAWSPYYPLGIRSRDDLFTECEVSWFLRDSLEVDDPEPH